MAAASTKLAARLAPFGDRTEIQRTPILIAQTLARIVHAPKQNFHRKDETPRSQDVSRQRGVPRREGGKPAGPVGVPPETKQKKCAPYMGKRTARTQPAVFEFRGARLPYGVFLRTQDGKMMTFFFRCGICILEGGPIGKGAKSRTGNPFASRRKGF